MSISGASSKFVCWIAAIAVFLFAYSSHASGEPLKVGFIFDSTIGPHGWRYSHEQCRIAVRDEFDEQVETAVFAKFRANEAEVEGVMRLMLDSGFKMFFVLSQEFEQVTHRLAEEYPDAIFEVATGRRQAKNVGVYSARFYEGFFAAGVLAGQVSSTGRIGYVGSIDIPEVTRGINAVTLGARLINPQAEVHAIWIDAWRNPALESLAANFLIDGGTDVIIFHTGGTEILQVAEARGVFSFGKASDMSDFGPNAHLAAISYDWNQFCINRVQEVIEGTWQSTDTWGGTGGPAVRLTNFNRKWVDPEIITFIQTLEDGIQSGKIHPFSGPIYDNLGNLTVEKDHVPTDADLLVLNWFAEGVKFK